MAPIELDVKNQQPILPGKQWATLEGKTTNTTAGEAKQKNTRLKEKPRVANLWE